MDQDKLKHSFTYHAPTSEQIPKYEQLRGLAGTFAESINSLCPESREKSLAITKLEEAVMWANKAIACNS